MGKFDGLNFDLIHDVYKLFKEHGTFVPLLQRLCWTRDMNWSLRIAGVYCFTLETGKLLDPMTFLYVGRTRNLHKRFCQHKQSWLRQYVLDNFTPQIWWGYILEENIPDHFDSMAHLENLCWKFKSELGLCRGVNLQRGI